MKPMLISKVIFYYYSTGNNTKYYFKGFFKCLYFLALQKAEFLSYNSYIDFHYFIEIEHETNI